MMVGQLPARRRARCIALAAAPARRPDASTSSSASLRLPTALAALRVGLALGSSGHDLPAAAAQPAGLARLRRHLAGAELAAVAGDRAVLQAGGPVISALALGGALVTAAADLPAGLARRISRLPLHPDRHRRRGVLRSALVGYLLTRAELFDARAGDALADRLGRAGRRAELRRPARRRCSSLLPLARRCCSGSCASLELGDDAARGTRRPRRAQPGWRCSAIAVVAGRAGHRGRRARSSSSRWSPARSPAGCSARPPAASSPPALVGAVAAARRRPRRRAPAARRRCRPAWSPAPSARRTCSGCWPPRTGRGAGG